VTTTEQRPLRIGEVAERVGVTTRTIRYYEELGLLARGEGRSKGAHRTYPDADVTRLAELIRLRDLLGLSLDELIAVAEAEDARAALRDQWYGDPTDDERASIVKQGFEIVRQQLALVNSRREKLDEFAADLEQRLERLAELRKELERGES
jgi:DNA-binding transcriptional MerR regulator